MKAPLEQEFVAGNQVDKEAAKRNRLYRYLINRFDATLVEWVRRTRATNMIELGCGEGRLAKLLETELRSELQSYRGFDVAAEVLPLEWTPQIQLIHKSLFNLEGEKTVPLVLCCEVLEHLPDPICALEVIHDLTSEYAIVSVPNEPWWRICNVARLTYLRSWGNTPGHIQHWNAKEFRKLVEFRFEIVEERHPFPWTMLFLRKKKD